MKRGYLQIQELHQLRRLVFSSRRIVEGQYSGKHASPLRGQSVEFSDYREYVPGDEVGEIDWKVFGRSDKLFIKLFEHQTDMTVQLLVDASASMAYSGRASSADAQRRRRSFRRSAPAAPPQETPDSKFDYAARMAVAIAFLVTQNQDKIGFGLAREGLEQFHPARGAQSHLYRIVEALESAVPEAEAGLADAIDAFAERSNRRSVLVVFSDLLERRDEILRALSRWTHRGSQVIVFQTLHADEVVLPDLADAVFIDSETSGEIRLNVDDVRGEYARRFHDFVEGWATALRSRNIDHNVVSTQHPYHRSLERYLVGRVSRS